MTTLLNPEQQMAVSHVDGPMLIIAGAGSGKTRVITYRIISLLEQGIPASSILGLTFTNKAAGEMKERVHALMQEDVLICTFHSLGARILRESIECLGYKTDFIIYDADDSNKLLKVCFNEANIPATASIIKAVKNLISNAKNDFQLPGDIEVAPYSSEAEMYLPNIYARYQKKLLDCNALDFDDLLFLTVQIFHKHPNILEHYQNRWKYASIDEYQDTNRSQYLLIQKLINKSRNLCVVGDPDQSIYSWRGADIRNILDFEQDYPDAKVIRLEQNYRSHQNILESANALIVKNKNRFKKNLWSDCEKGEKVKVYRGYDERDEVSFIINRIGEYQDKKCLSFNDMVIFYRTNFQSRVFEDLLLRYRIPYIVVGGVSFYQRKEIKDMLAFLKIAQSGADYVSFTRTINLPKRGIGAASLDKIRAEAIRNNINVFDCCVALVNDKIVDCPFKLTKRQRAGLTDYVQIILSLRRKIETERISVIVKSAIQESGYLEHLKLDKETYEDKKENVNELIAKAAEWEKEVQESSLEAFLEELTLKTTLDETSEEVEKVSLMTIHNGKGLEFDLTFLAGMEETLFPHVNSLESLESIEEERRLCYVGMTRARKFLYMTSCQYRFLWGMIRPMKASRFFRELPRDRIERVTD